MVNVGKYSIHGSYGLLYIYTHICSSCTKKKPISSPALPLRFSLLTLGPAAPPKQWAKMAPGAEIFVRG